MCNEDVYEIYKKPNNLPLQKRQSKKLQNTAY